ncbi:MAG: ABC transporter substrate-binding protein [Dehalococcoidia bacterium]
MVTDSLFGRVLRRNVSRRRGIRLGALGVAGTSAWLVACGGGDSDTAEQGPSGAAGTAAPGTAAAAQPVRGGTISYRIIGTPPLDPHTNTTFRAQTQAGFVYSRLLKFKTGADPSVAFNYEIAPDLAASTEIPDDGTQLTFKLQPNATFHDKPPVSGRAATSEDVKFSLDRFRNAPKNTNRNAFGFDRNPLVTAVETPDATTVVMKLAKPYAPILNLFANPQYLWIMPKEIEGGFDPNKEQIGSGPWMLESVQPDIVIEMARNPSWFVQEQPYADRVRAVVVPETAQEVAQFQAEALDVAGIPNENKPEVESSNPQASWVTYLPTTYTFISPQQRDGSPFRDQRIRQALSLAIDREAWGELIYLGEGVKFLNAVPASMGKWWLDPQSKDAGDGARWFKSDPAEAKKLLQAAGFEGQQFRFIFANNAYGERFNQGAEATAGMLNQSGFNAQIVTQDYLREYISAGQTFFGNYEGTFYGLQTPFTDPHDYLFSMLDSASQRNHAGIQDPRLEEMLQDEERTLDEAARVKKVQDIQRYVMEQMYYVPVAVGDNYIATQPWLKNYQYSATYGTGTENYPTIWLDRK